MYGCTSSKRGWIIIVVYTRTGQAHGFIVGRHRPSANTERACSDHDSGTSVNSLVAQPSYNYGFDVPLDRTRQSLPRLWYASVKAVFHQGNPLCNEEVTLINYDSVTSTVCIGWLCLWTEQGPIRNNANFISESDKPTVRCSALYIQCFENFVFVLCLCLINKNQQFYLL